MMAVSNIFNIVLSLGSSVIVYHWFLLHEDRLPKWLLPIYAYGKTMKCKEGNNNHQNNAKTANESYNHCKGNSKDKTTLRAFLDILLIPLPKWYFQYFYDFAVTFSLLLLLCIPIVNRLGLGFIVKLCVSIVFSDSVDKMNNISNLTDGSTIFWTVFLLELLQISRRCYECHFVSVFATKSRMTVFQTIFGFAYYVAVSSALLRMRLDSSLNNLPLSSINVLGIGIFVIGFFLQYKSHVMLANLRKRVRPSDQKELIVTTDHLIPFGGGFRLLSSPHYTAECLIYLGLWLVSSFDTSMAVILFNVIANHLMMSELSHRWYKKTFSDDYPSERKMLIPWLL